MTAPHEQGRLAIVQDEGFDPELRSEAGRVVVVAPHRIDDESAKHDGANLRRLAACWNACDGLSTQAVEDLGPHVRALSESAAKLLSDFSRAAAAEREQLRSELETARALLLEALPHINPKAAVMALARTGPLSDAYVNTRVRIFLEGA